MISRTCQEVIVFVLYCKANVIENPNSSVECRKSSYKRFYWQHSSALVLGGSSDVGR